MPRLRTVLALFVGCFSVFSLISLRAADTLPTRLTDEAYWNLIVQLSEVPSNVYPHAVFTGNEPGYQEMLPQLTRIVAPGGTYLGVGPEQNYTYMVALKSKIGILIDIRRDQMLQHLMFKALFELSTDRPDFVGKLFSRKRPPQLTADSSVQDIFRAYATVGPDGALVESNWKEILSTLRTTHRFALTDIDEQRMRAIFILFAREGVLEFRSSQESPGYMRNMTQTDASGKNWSFLASKENFNWLRDMFAKNLIIPVVGDFTGPKAVRAVGKYLRDHGAIVNVFYVSNVEDYIQPSWNAYTANIASLPIDSSSMFVRWTVSSRPPWIDSMDELFRTFKRPAGIR
jgi:hypothetical protein